MKMKFCIEKTIAAGGRLGIISQAGLQGNVNLETPLCTLFTKGGCAPHLSSDMLRRVAAVPDIAVMNVGSLADHHESISEFGKGLAEFTAMKKHLIFSTLQDASAAIFPGKNDKSGVAVWGKGGKIKLDTALYMKIQESFVPDWFQALSDGDIDKDCGLKRLTKSVDRTLDFLDEVVEKKEKSEVLKNSSLIGVIEGGYNEWHRQRSATETASRPVDGFLIEGFEKGNSNKDLFSDPDFTKILLFTMQHLPTDKPRFMETVWSPLQVIKAFRCGVDIFSSAILFITRNVRNPNIEINEIETIYFKMKESFFTALISNITHIYPYTLTEKGFALVCDYNIPPHSQPARLELQNSIPKKDESQELYIDLNNPKYFEDFGPLMNGCQCYTCSHFSCAYIHHLLNTKELLAYVLLMMHNFHQYFDFFQNLRQAIKEDKLDELQDSLSLQIATPLDR